MIIRVCGICRQSLADLEVGGAGVHLLGKDSERAVALVGGDKGGTGVQTMPQTRAFSIPN